MVYLPIFKQWLNHMKNTAFILILLTGNELAFSQAVVASALENEKNLPAYREAFYNKVHQFGTLNRFNINNVNRDKYSNCYLSISVDTTVLADGSIKDIVIRKSSDIAIVDKYFTYIITQSAPFKPFQGYFGSELKELVLTEQFELDLNHNHDTRSQKSCN